MQASETQAPDRPSAAPQGVGFGVALDWGLTVELLGIALVTLITSNAFQAGAYHLTPALFAAGNILGALVIGAIGEALRAGRRWAWLIQVILTGGLSLFGLIRIPYTVAQVAGGHDWALVSQIILVTTCPLIFFRLIQPPSRAWFGHVTPSMARTRHGSARWLATIIACAIIGGVLVVIELYS